MDRAVVRSNQSCLPADVHRVFMDARAECDRLIGGRRTPSDPELRREATRAIQELESRWKDRVLAACRKIAGDQS